MPLLHAEVGDFYWQGTFLQICAKTCQIWGACLPICAWHQEDKSWQVTYQSNSAQNLAGGFSAYLLEMSFECRSFLQILTRLSYGLIILE